jgi:hypothetical protein
MGKLLLMLATSLVAVLALTVRPSATPDQYVPRAQLCVDGTTGLCARLPAAVGADPALAGGGVGYPGILGPLPTTTARDVETPFDNMAWQMFVALNWAQGKATQPPAVGLSPSGPRVWQSYRRVSALFGNSPALASCANPNNLPVFAIGSDGQGNPAPNNEEYFQASTNLPLIDINGNWTIYERRVNDVEARYLLAPNGNPAQTLTTRQGQSNFIAQKGNVVRFTSASKIPAGANGSIEIKASWRILNRKAGDDPSHYYNQPALVTVASDLVRGGTAVCDSVTLGLVGMHIIQRNTFDSTKANLPDQWIWATFEHSENAPLAASPCTVNEACTPPSRWINKPSCGAAAPATNVRYSFYNPVYRSLGTNVVPIAATGRAPRTFVWNAARPYAESATTAATARPQVTRCWSIYPLTAQIDSQWQLALAKVNTPFRYYTLIGTQWGARVETRPGLPVPGDAVPGMLSNTTLETYIQNYNGSLKNGPGPGSCVSCHGAFATLSVGSQPRAKSDFSFLPGLVLPRTARSKVPRVPDDRRARRLRHHLSADAPPAPSGDSALTW